MATKTYAEAVAGSKPATTTGRSTRTRVPTEKLRHQQDELVDRQRNVDQETRRREDRQRKQQRKKDQRDGKTVEVDERDRRLDLQVASHSVASKPAVVASKGLQMRTNKVPPSAPAEHNKSSGRSSSGKENRPPTNKEDGHRTSRTSHRRSRFTLALPFTYPLSRTSHFTGNSSTEQAVLQPCGMSHPLHVRDSSPLAGHGQPASKSPSPLRQPGRSSPRSDFQDLLDFTSPLCNKTPERRPRSRTPPTPPEAPPAKAQKTSAQRGRPRAADYDDESQAFIEAANSRYRALIVAVDAFPDSATEVTFVRAVADHANSIVSPEERRTLTPDLIRIIKQRGAQIRGEFKSRARALVETCWDLSTSLSAEETEHNRDLIANLKFQSGFVYKTLGEDKKDLDGRSGLYQNRIIEKMIFQTVFRRRSDEGVIHADLFKPIPAPALALTFTSIDCGLDEWVSGSRIALEFTTRDYLEVYQGHLRDLQHFQNMTKKHNLFPRMCRRLSRAGRLHAGVGNSATVGYEQRIPSSAMLAAMKEHEAEPSATESDDSAPEDGVSGPLKRGLPTAE
ncbi:hypothetical protein NP233_g4849 [Leucocoprinus birnbaumii]|uniref:DUF6532 domain-containing protein n=1 Tax=Leucocoprinus birnbaumii TaxID=56174 RepID=A0AAD5VTX9_9AGAR|nr:hypothetical protein NP233_g4849 [Leucocoprinus birnbaumii]